MESTFGLLGHNKGYRGETVVAPLKFKVQPLEQRQRWKEALRLTLFLLMGCAVPTRSFVGDGGLMAGQGDRDREASTTTFKSVFRAPLSFEDRLVDGDVEWLWGGKDGGGGDIGTLHHNQP